jgi:hypothetical protein
MIVMRTKVHVAGLSGIEVTEFLAKPSDAKYRRWWQGTHLELHLVKPSGRGVGDLVYMDEFIGARRVRMTGVVVESVPGKRITWHLEKGIRLPVRLSLELEDDDEGVTVEHTLRIGFAGIGRVLDPIFRIYFSEKFARAMDEHVRTEFPKLERMLHG